MTSTMIWRQAKIMTLLKPGMHQSDERCFPTPPPRRVVRATHTESAGATYVDRIHSGKSKVPPSEVVYELGTQLDRIHPKWLPESADNRCCLRTLISCI